MHGLPNTNDKTGIINRHSAQNHSASLAIPTTDTLLFQRYDLFVLKKWNKKHKKGKGEKDYVYNKVCSKQIDVRKQGTWMGTLERGKKRCH